MLQIIKVIKRGYFVEVEDGHGKVIHTFYKKRFADMFYEAVSKEKEVRKGKAFR